MRVRTQSNTIVPCSNKNIDMNFRSSTLNSSNEAQMLISGYLSELNVTTNSINCYCSTQLVNEIIEFVEENTVKINEMLDSLDKFKQNTFSHEINNDLKVVPFDFLIITEKINFNNKIKLK